MQDRARPQQRLRIGIDATSLGAGRGYGRFLRELLPPLVALGGHDYVLLADADTADALAGSLDLGLPVVVARTSRGQARAASARSARSPLDLLRMGRAAAAARLDLVFFPSVYSWFPVPGRVPVALGIHDVIPERYGHEIFPTRRTRLLWRLKRAWACRRASGILTVSEWSRRALAEQLGLAADEIFVAEEAPAAAFAPAPDPAPRQAWLRAHDLPGDAAYFVYVGGFNPHKNLGRLVDAFAAATTDDAKAELRLLLVGDHAGDLFHADLDALRRRIQEAGVASRVHWTGFVPDAELRHLYAGALAVVLPSLEEGFGLPAVEAAACGTPCVATARSPLPQLLEGGGLFVEPTDAGALADALRRLAAEPHLRRDLGARALARARALDWRRAAERTRGALEAIAARAGAHARAHVRKGRAA